jgi:protoporphyrinogen oxidase
MQQLSNLEDEFPGLVVTGNYVAGVSTATCIDTAVASVDRLIENIGSIAAIPTLAQTAH